MLDHHHQTPPASSLPSLNTSHPSPFTSEAPGTSTHAAIQRLLRHECLAIETYQRVIDVLGMAAAAPFKAILDGHHQRAGVLRERLVDQDGQPEAVTGFWDVLTPGDTSTAAVDHQRLIDALATIEGHGVADYRRELGRLDDATRIQVEAALLPAQERAIAALATLASQAKPDQLSGPQA